MDSHLLAVSGVSSCSQRNQVEPNKTRGTRNAYDQEAKRTAIPTPKRAGFFFLQISGIMDSHPRGIRKVAGDAPGRCR
jgi:hypothetical protein